MLLAFLKGRTFLAHPENGMAAKDRLIGLWTAADNCGFEKGYPSVHGQNCTRWLI